MIDPQAKRILDDLRELAHLFDLELPRDGGVLGERLLDVAAAGVADCFLTESDPDGVRWPDLSPEYAERKAKVSPGNPMGYLFGKMSDRREIEGERAVTSESASMVYGTTPETRAEATYFQDPDGSRNQPPRPFFALTRQAIELADAILDQHFNRHVKP